MFSDRLYGSLPKQRIHFLLDKSPFLAPEFLMSGMIIAFRGSSYGSPWSPSPEMTVAVFLHSFFSFFFSFCFFFFSTTLRCACPNDTALLAKIVFLRNYVPGLERSMYLKRKILTSSQMVKMAEIFFGRCFENARTR